MSVAQFYWNEPTDVGPFTPTAGEDYAYAFDGDLNTVGNFDIAEGDYGEMVFSAIGVPSVSGTITACRIRLIWDTPVNDGRLHYFKTGSITCNGWSMGDSGYYESVIQIPLASMSTLLNSSLIIGAYEDEYIDQDGNRVPIVGEAATYSFKGMWLEVTYTAAPLYPVIDTNPATTAASVLYLPSHFSSSTGYNPVVNTTAAALGLVTSPATTTATAVYFYRSATYTAPARRPSSATYTGTTPTNPTYAYDTTAASVDNTTHSSCVSTGVSTQVYSFSGAGTVSGTLHVKLFSVDTDSGSYTDKFGETQDLRSSVYVAVSLDGGFSYQTPAVSFPSQVASWPGMIASNVDLTKTLSGVTISNIRVKVTVSGVYNTNVGTLTASAAVSDIVIL